MWVVVVVCRWSCVVWLRVGFGGEMRQATRTILLMALRNPFGCSVCVYLVPNTLCLEINKLPSFGIEVVETHDCRKIDRNNVRHTV